MFLADGGPKYDFTRMVQIMAFQKPRDKLIEEIQLRLGGGIVDLELDPSHLNYAIDVALGKYRQRSDNATQESYVFVEIQPDQSTYTLPEEVQEIRSVYRNGLGSTTSGGVTLDPFSLANTQTFYGILNPSGLGGGGAGSLATFDLAAQYQSLVGRLFGKEVLYNFDSASKRITFARKFVGQEQIALHCFNTKPEDLLFRDPYARPWLRSYSVAVCKQILGEARGKYSSIAGPGGGVQLNGSAMLTEAQADIEALEKELELFVEQHGGLPFVIG